MHTVYQNFPFAKYNLEKQRERCLERPCYVVELVEHLMTETLGTCVAHLFVNVVNNMNDLKGMLCDDQTEQAENLLGRGHYSFGFWTRGLTLIAVVHYFM